MKTSILLLSVAIGFLGITGTNAQSIADNWHQFRGPENNGVSLTANPPLEWSEQKNLLWIGPAGSS